MLIGEFLCIDKQANLILGNTYQQVQRYNSQSAHASHSQCSASVQLKCKSLQVICMSILTFQQLCA